MSQKKDTKNCLSKTAGKGKNINYINYKKNSAKIREDAIRILSEVFMDKFEPELIASVAHEYNWDVPKATMALELLSKTKQNYNKNPKLTTKVGTKLKAKSLPGTLREQKSAMNKSSNSSNATHYSSTNSLLSGHQLQQSGSVWQRHYKSKPQSPGLLTMIPDHSKEIIKLKSCDNAVTLKNKQLELKKASDVIEKILKLILNNIKVMILMRGLPGSGKTQLAQIIVSSVTKKKHSQHILSTDDYFIMLGRGNYAYDYNQLAQAHNWNKKRVFEAFKRGINPVIVDNTNIQAWEMQPYVVMAVEHGYLVEVLEPFTDWKNNEAELAKRNVHCVPREKIRQMLERYEPGWTGEKLIKSFGLKNKHSNSEQITQETLCPTNSLLAQHRQNAVLDIPEKPKRKKNNLKKKQRNPQGDATITEDKEKQLEELNKFFAEYGRTIDPISKQKVLESGVSIAEVVSRMRKLQGNVLPLPNQNTKTNHSQPSVERSNQKQISEKVTTQQVSNYSVPRRDSISESVEADTISSCNASETSEGETDSEADLPQWKEIKNYFKRAALNNVASTDLLQDYDDEDERLAESCLSEPLTAKISKSQISSSQEELSLIDFETRATPASFSQDELSIIDFDTNITSGCFCQEDLSSLNFDGRNDQSARHPSSSSSSTSEEQETQMLSLEESLKDVFKNHTQEKNEDGDSAKKPERQNLTKHKISEVPLLESLVDALTNRYENFESSNTRGKCIEKGVPINESLLQMLVDKYSAEDEEASDKGDPNYCEVNSTQNFEVSERKISPDLEEVPLPTIPVFDDVKTEPEQNLLANIEGKEPLQRAEDVNDDKCNSIDSISDWQEPKRDKFEDIVSSWEHPAEPQICDDASSKPARSKNSLLGAIKKTVVNTRDKSPEKLLRSADLSWSSIPFTLSWEEVNKKPQATDSDAQPKPQRKFSTTKSDSSTNTIYSDFDLWKKNDKGIVILNAQSRNINQNFKEHKVPSIRATEILMLDKGSMTTDIEEIDILDTESALDTMKGMFPNINIEHLNDILEKCRGNVQWAIEVLLETPQGVENLPDKIQTAENLSLHRETQAPPHVDYAALDNILISDGKKTIKRRKNKKSCTGELSLLKKQIEESIQINEELYQDRTLFLKKLRHGEIEFGDGPIEPPAKEQEIFEETVKEEDEEDEESIPMKVDPDFFRALLNHFQSSDESNYNKQSTLIPSIINIPISLAQQIYECWVENVNSQLEEMLSNYDQMIKEDELLAAALQEQEFEYRQPDLREVMDMELAMLLYRQNQAQLHENGRETIATKLSKQLLFEAYPNLDKTMLLDLFESEGRSFQKTIDVLNARENESPATVIAPEFLAAHGNKLLEQAKSENFKKNMEEMKKPIIVVKQRTTKKEETDKKNILIVNPVEYRQKAAFLHQQRNECRRLAQEAFRKKSFSVASYFSQIANLYKERITELSREPFPPTVFEGKINKEILKIDLHFLLVSEALQILDMFLDCHIKELRKKAVSSIGLGLITGRGQHSSKGKSKIKPAVIKRLMQRKLRFVLINPGMIKVFVRKTNFLSEEL